MSSALANLRSALKEDSIFKKVRESVAGVERTIDTEKILREAKMLHNSRPSRDLHKHKPTVTKLYEADTVDLKARSRLTEMKADLVRNSEILEDVLGELEKHIMTKYADELSEWSNQPSRRAAVEKILAPGITVLENLKSCDSVLDLYIRDIDQASYRISNSINLLKLVLERPNQVV